jgi:single-strand DNA-binding protein
LYTKEELIALNTSYHHNHRVTDADVAKINRLVSLIEAARQIDPTRPLEGDRIICVSPEKGVVSRHGHIQNRMSFDNWMTICTDPYTPFVDESLRSDASGGYWISVEEKDIALFTFVGQELKTFCAWGHMGMTGNGAIDFQAEVFVWELTHPSFLLGVSEHQKGTTMLNKIMLIGNLGKDPELNVTAEGTPVTKFSLAVNRKYKARNGEQKEETEWFNIVAWRQLAEICERYLHKGSKVYIEGRLTQRKYTDKNGVERTAVEAIANDMQMLSPKQPGTASLSDVGDPFLPDLFS